MISSKGERTRVNTRDMVLSSLFIALVFVATKLINVELPISVNGGLVHLGTGMLYIIALGFGKRQGAIAGAFGMALFDIFSPWVIWAPGTFVVRWIMGYMVGAIAYSGGRKGKNLVWNIIAMLAGGIWMIVGYYIYEVILYKNWITAFASIPGDSLQIAIGAPAALLAVMALKKVKYFDQYVG
jgi:uncharacterized membrane protein